LPKILLSSGVVYSLVFSLWIAATVIYLTFPFKAAPTVLLIFWLIREFVS